MNLHRQSRDVEKQETVARSISWTYGVSPKRNVLEPQHNSSSAETLVTSDGPPKPDIEITAVEVADEEEAPHILPPKHGSRWTRYLHCKLRTIEYPICWLIGPNIDNFFTSYRKSFALIFVANVFTLIGLTIRDDGSPKLSDIGNATSVNLMVSILFRQENFVNLLYEVATCAPMWFPLYIRRKLAKVFHYGGFHSGCGVAAVAWYLLYTAIATKNFIAQPSQDVIANVFTSYILISMLCIILVGAHPRFRERFHDYFEAIHRFVGWSVLIIFWTQTYFATALVAAETKKSFGIALVKSPSFWCLLISTCCVILSWLRLRPRKVSAEVLSDHATRLHFKYSNMKPFYNVRVSTQPLLEWHSFHTIPNEKGGFSVVVSNAGDWTKKTIAESPEKLWVRGDPAYGLLVCARLFKRIVIVATGSGIGPCLSLMYADLVPSRILWSTPKPLATYGEGVVNAVRKADPDAIIWDTRAQGRPDLVELTYKLYVESGAEAVFIISNPKVTKKVVYGMETRGIAAYGAIFDS